MAGIPLAQVGDKYGYLTLLQDSGRRDSNGSVIWKCKCDCGNIVFRSQNMIHQSLIGKHIISCGCMRPKDRYHRITPEEREKCIEALGQIDGTTIAGICRHKINKNNTSGVRGVSKSGNKWRARLMIAGKEKSAFFDTMEQAIAYRKYLEQTYFDPIKEKYLEQKGEKK